MKPKIYHRGGLVNAAGDVSARCYKRPRKIDLSKASWTLLDDAVTCPKCRAMAKSATAS